MGRTGSVQGRPAGNVHRMNPTSTAATKQEYVAYLKKCMAETEPTETAAPWLGAQSRKFQVGQKAEFVVTGPLGNQTLYLHTFGRDGKADSWRKYGEVEDPPYFL